jgi:hypothetical protein
LPVTEIETDAGQPGSEPLRPPQAVKSQHRVKDGVLCNILGQLRIAQGTPADRQHERAMPNDQVAEGGSVSALGGPDEVDVVMTRVYWPWRSHRSTQ